MNQAMLADGRALSAGMLRRLFIGQCLVLALHLPWMPLWMLGVALAVAFWRYRQLRQRLPRAGIQLRLIAVGVVLVALWWEYGGLHGVEALTGVLLGIYLLKLLETHNRRDARVIVILGFVTLAAAFLHDQGVLMGAGAMFAAAWLVQSLITLAGGRQARLNWRETVWLMALSAPLMMLLFLVFPRVGPLWALPQPDHAATGLSDQIAPGDIAALSRSGARAFRVSFEGAEPSPAERYWRVYTLSHFDGERWLRLTPAEQAAALGRTEQQFVQEGTRSPFDDRSMPPRYRAELLLEPDSRPWRPSLGAPLASDIPQRFLGDGTLEGLSPLTSRSLLSIASSGAAPAHPDPAGMAWHTLLPERANPQTQALAERLWHEAGGDARAYLQRVLTRFGEAPFRYTLEPPRLTGRNRVDDFLFDTRAGYCEHYASAMAVLARAVGIPARVVVGFLGGERHPDGHFIVRDYDAHAWNEVWLDGAWRRMDPTAAIAPERIEQGPQAVSGSRETFLADAPFSPLRLRELGWANQLRLDWERMEYRWQRGVIGYRDISSEELLNRLSSGLVSLWQWIKAPLSMGPWALPRGVLVLLIAIAGALFAAAVRAGWLSRTFDERQAMAQLQVWLKRRGWAPRDAEPPAMHLRRIAPAAGRAGQALQTCADDYERLAYAAVSADERRARRKRLLETLRRIRRDLPRRH